MHEQNLQGPSRAESSASSRFAAASRGGLIGSIALLALVGCLKVPPQVVGTDRIEFGQVVAESMKRQTLLNVVRLRYADTPQFLDVGSIINSYTVGGTGTAGWSLPSHTDPTVLSLGTEHNWSNTPTVTYQPMTGEQFSKSMLRPIPPLAIFQLVQGGWPADLVLGTLVDSINGLRNDSGKAFMDRDFHRLIEAVARIQADGALAVQPEAGEEENRVLLVLRPDDDSLTGHEDEKLLLHLLKLDSTLHQFELVYGLAPSHPGEVAVISRSLLELMLLLGVDLEVPAGKGMPERALPFQRKGNRDQAPPPVRIRSGLTAPQDAYASVSYKGFWYWIDDRDVPSKRVFTFMMVLSSLQETGQNGVGPVVSVPSR